MTLFEALHIAYRRKALVASAIAIGVAIAAVVYASTPSRYEVEALLVITQGAAADRTEASKNIAQEAGALARVATTDDVLRAAVSRIGVGRFGLASNTFTQTDLDRLRQFLRARVDSKSNLLELSFRGPDPVLAADFANAVADSVIERQARLVRGSDALRFIDEQTKRLEVEAQKSMSDLAEFGKETSIYSVDGQRDLLLKRASEIEGSLSSTRSSIAKAEGQRRALTEQLLKLKPVTSSPFVTNLVQDLGGADKNKGPKAIEGDTRTFSSYPPLLLVRVYQDALVELLKMNTELASNESLENSLRTELETLKGELEKLSQKQSRFEELKRAAALTSAGAKAFGKRRIEDAIAANSAKAQLSEVRVLQTASSGGAPVFPRLDFLLLMGVFLGGLLAVLGVALVESFALRADAAPAEADGDSDPAAPPTDEASQLRTPIGIVRGDNLVRARIRTWTGGSPS